jgi:glycosyltransferase involved in cell wall biosynthesis
MVVWNESNGLNRGVETGARAAVKRWFIRRMDAGLVPGSASAEYLARFARPGFRSEVLPNVVDPRLFRLDTQRRSELRPAARRELGAEGLTLLFSGRMLPLKGVADLLAAFEQATFPDAATLILLGGGDLEASARECAARLQPPKKIVQLPFRQPQDLAPVYAAADVLVLPSREEPWGFVVLEAMLAQVPTLVSDVVGAGPDLVRHGETGWVFRAGDRNELREQLESLPKQDLTACGARAQKVALEYARIERSVDAFVRATTGIPTTTKP